MSWVIILLIYSIIVFFFSYWIYKNNYVFYKPFEYIDPETKEKINVHSLYPEFACLDKISFLKIFIGNFLFGLLKFLIDIFLAMMQIIRLKQLKKKLKDPTSNPEEWKILSHTISFWTKWLLKVNGIKVIKKEAQYEKVYKKYLGDDYSFDPNEKYSLLICNHLGFYDIVLNMALNSAGFLAKFEVKDYLLVGTIAQGINCLFVKRESEEDRMRTFAQLEQRQKDFYEGRSLTPLLLFPEETTTNGKYILKFKRGAFYHLMPIKPEIVHIDNNSPYHIAVGAQNLFFNTLSFFCFLGTKMYYTFLPVIKPTEYMFKNYNHFGKEKWEIYAEVVRKIYCEVGGFTESNLGYRDSEEYYYAMVKGEFDYEKILKKD